MADELVPTDNRAEEYAKEGRRLLKLAASLMEDSAYLEMWFARVGTQIRKNPTDNIKAASRIEAEHGREFLEDMLKAVRVVHADRYAGSALHVINNYVQLEKHMERLETYWAGLKDRPQFEAISRPRKGVVSV